VSVLKGIFPYSRRALADVMQFTCKTNTNRELKRSHIWRDHSRSPAACCLRFSCRDTRQFGRDL